MRIICLVKVVPNVEDMHYSEETQSLVRDNVKLILNPDDAAAVALALRLKAQKPDEVQVELLTMGPPNVAAPLRELLRLGCHSATVLCGPAFAGSDSYATAAALAHCLKQREYKLLLTGTHALDGDTGHIPAQLAERLGLPVLTGATGAEEASFFTDEAVLECEEEQQILRFGLRLPAVVGLCRESCYKLPYLRYEDMEKPVDDRIHFLSAEELGLPAEELGAKGSLTTVLRAFAKPPASRSQKVLPCTRQGIHTVYEYLVKEGFIRAE